MTIKKIAIFDMDGVLVDSSWRYKVLPCGSKIDLDHWRKHEKAAFFDPLLPMSQEYKEMLNNPDYYVIIATARLCHSADLAFIDMKLGRPDMLICRSGEKDTRGGAQLKIEGLKRLFNLKQFKQIDKSNIVMFEDNAKYLKAICDYFHIRGVYIPSQQGH